MGPPLVFAWFANPAMLWGLGAASLPIIIHLLNRRKFREMSWAAMRFLLAALRKNQRRIRIEQWILLAIRTLLVIFVVTAMARPFLESLGALPLLPGQRTHWVLVLDGSLSMDYTTAGNSRFDQAKEIASRLVKDARQGDAISVVLMADPPRAIIGAPAFNHDAARREIEAISLPHGGTDLEASFRKIDEVLGASTIPRKQLVVLTDLQAASWRRAGAKGDEALRRALAKVEVRHPQSTVIDLGAASGENRAVTDLALSPQVVTVGVPAVARAVVKNFGREPASGVRVRFTVDTRLEDEQVHDLNPGEELPLAFNVRFDAPGEHVISVAIGDDPLKLDNVRRLSVPVREALRVLLVDGDPKTELFHSETDFLAQALSPETESANGPSAIVAEVVPEGVLARRDLGTIDAVVLCNIAQFTREEVNALEAYLKQGGGVVVFGGDQVMPDNYNRLLFNDGKGFLPARLGDVVGDPQQRENPAQFDPLGFRHPIIAAYAGQDAGVIAGLTGVKTFRYQKLSLPRDSTAKVALAFDRDGDPAIIEAPRGRGRVIQVATSADRDWTSWPIHLSYPPVMEQLILQAASGRFADRNVRVGQPLDESLPPSAAGAPATVHRPAGAAEAIKLVAAGDVSRLRFDKTDLSGLYRVEIGPPVGQSAWFVANPDPAESDPAKLDQVALQRAVPGWSFHYDNDWRPLRQNAAAVTQRGELHRPLLWGVLILLLVESVLAWLFGHHR